MKTYFVMKSAPVDGVMPADPWCVVSAPDKDGIRDVISDHASRAEAVAAIRQYRAETGNGHHYQVQYAHACGYET